MAYLATKEKRVWVETRVTSAHLENRVLLVHQEREVWRGRKVHLESQEMKVQEANRAVLVKKVQMAHLVVMDRLVKKANG